MAVDLLYVAVFLACGGWVFVWVFGGWYTSHRRIKQHAHQLESCPICHAEFTRQAWLDDLSAQMGQRLVRTRYCRNGHSWAAGYAGPAAEESTLDRLSGWLP